MSLDGPEKFYNVGDSSQQRQRFKSDKVQRRLRLSDELRDVFEILQRMGKTNDSTDLSFQQTLLSDQTKNRRPGAIVIKLLQL